MPIYEFYCSDCHMLFSFLSRSVNTRRRPGCPRCERPRLERRASAFAIGAGGETSGTDGDADPDALAGLDPSRLEQAMDGLAQQTAGISEDDPSGMARVMRSFYERSGMKMGDGIEQALQRMESGEDPDRIEEEMGDLLEQDDQLFAATGARGLGELSSRLRAPRADPTLYEL